MLILYEFFLIIYVIVSLPILLLKGKWHGGFAQRFGALSKDIKEKLDHPANIWIHAVSVGEVIAVMELIRRLKEKYPNSQTVLTTSTQTGHELAVKKLSGQAVVLWSPVDFSWVVSSFIQNIKPKIYIVAETEIWPNLFTRLHARNVPIVLINGRISDNSYGRYLKVRWFMKRYLGYMNAFCMQSQLDAERIVSIGAPKDKVLNIGNVKFDDLPEDKTYTAGDFGFSVGDRLWVAGSTHPGEEEIVLDIFERLKAKFSGLRLVVAPRHVERTAEIQKMFEGRGMRSVRFSQLKSSGLDSKGIVVVDTIGHLRALYSLAEIVFVGKSLTVPGGHNIIEPAYFSKPVIVGPHMQNFRDVMAAFKNERAVIEVQDFQELESAVERLLGNPQESKALGAKAKGVIVQQQGATGRTVDIISQFLGKGL